MFLKGNYSASQALARGQAFMKKLLLSGLRSLRNFCFPSASGSPLSSGFRLPDAEGAKVSQKSQKIKFKWVLGNGY